MWGRKVGGMGACARRRRWPNLVYYLIVHSECTIYMHGRASAAVSMEEMEGRFPARPVNGCYKLQHLRLPWKVMQPLGVTLRFD